MFAFAGNSVLCRLALADFPRDSAISDPITFTLIRLLSGTLVLFVICLALPNQKTVATREPDAADKAAVNKPKHFLLRWLPGLWLMLYALGFSFAYQYLDTGTGAFILFATVQLSLFVAAKRGGEQFGAWQLVGALTALLGLFWLLVPAEFEFADWSPMGAMGMFLAGVAWALYTLAGKQSAKPILDTRNNFAISLLWLVLLPPLLLFLYSLASVDTHISLRIVIETEGLWLAVFSGGLASGVGYAVWYSALGYLKTSVAAVLQLSVPVLATAGGVIWLDELLTTQMLVSSSLILLGIALTIAPFSSSKANN
ncbi:DMT family transporter [Corallincola platygyrae]